MRQHTKNRNALTCTCFDKVGMGSVTDDQMRFAVKFAAKALQYEKRGILIDRIGTHWLRSGGACAHKLAGCDVVEIKKLRRWMPKNNAFLEYIQQQSSTFSKGMAAGMSRIAAFANMEGSTEREDLRHQTMF